MKNNLVKRITVLAAVAVLGMSMAACGNAAEEPAVNEMEAEGTPVAEDEVKETETPAEPEAPAEAEAPAETETPAEAEAPTDAVALTGEEYLTKAQEASDKLMTTMANSQTEIAAMDMTDVDAVKEYIDGLKAPLAEFAALQAPEEYAEVQSKFKSSCEALIEYYDLIIEMMNPEAEADAAELTAKTTELLTIVQTDLTEAYNLMSAVSGEEAVAQ